MTSLPFPLTWGQPREPYTPRPEPRRCAECGQELPPAQVGNFCELHRLVRKEGGW